MLPAAMELRFRRAYGTRIFSSAHPPLKWRATVRGPSGTAIIFLHNGVLDNETGGRSSSSKNWLSW
jgi:hypothetical protein